MKFTPDQREHLRRQIVRSIRDCTGLFETLVMPAADTILEKTIDVIRSQYAGESVYIGHRRTDLPELIRKEFNGRNRDELIRKHGISRTMFYEYIKVKPADA